MGPGGSNGVQPLVHDRRVDGQPRLGGHSRRTGRVGRVAAVLTVGAFAVFVLMWAGFAYALAVDPAVLDDAWAWFQGLQMPLAVVVWIVFLPLVVGLWIWESTWPPLVGLALGLGMLAWTLASVSSTIRLLRGR